MLALDLDGDGDQDVIQSVGGNANTMYLNDGTGRFVAVGQGTDFDNPGGISYTLAAFGADGDGDLDVAEGSFSSAEFYFYEGREETGTVTSLPICLSDLYPGAGALQSWDDLLVDEQGTQGEISYDILDMNAAPIVCFAGLLPDMYNRHQPSRTRSASLPEHQDPGELYGFSGKRPSRFEWT